MSQKRNSRHIERIETTAGAADALGDMHLPDPNRLGLICSQKCPGDVILKTYGFARLGLSLGQHPRDDELQSSSG